MGTPSAAVPTLQRILDDKHEVVAIWTQPDKPSGRGNRLTAPPVKEFALANNLTVYQPVKIKAAETLELLQSQNNRIRTTLPVKFGIPSSLIKRLE